MPSWKKHLIFNSFLIITWLMFFFNYNLINNYLLLLFLISFSYFFSLFPDIDTSKSYIRNILSFLLALILVIYLFFNLNIHSFLQIAFAFTILYVFFRFFPTKHRGITHSLWFSILCSLFMTIILWLIFSFSSFRFVIYFFFILSGYVSHLFLDRIFKH